VERREFIAVLGGTGLAWPLAARAQQPDRVRRVGMLMPNAESDPENQGSITSFRDALVQFGWVEGRNLRIDYRWAGGDLGKLTGYAAELVALMPDAIFVTNSVATAALQRATRSVPIVFADVPDPIAAGFVSSVARPDGNITGLALYEHAIGAKRLELLKQLAPGVTRVLFIYDPSSPISSVFFSETEAAASSLGVKTTAAPVHNLAEIEAAINAFAREPNGGLITVGHPPLIAHRDKVFTLAARHRLPAVYPQRFYVAEGGLASYGVNRVDQYRGAASYVDRILKGAKPGDLPVQFADKFELVINLKTAKALGIDVPATLLARTDEVIE
jgi:putative ABC transport system substrate-binding protein